MREAVTTLLETVALLLLAAGLGLAVAAWSAPAGLAAAGVLLLGSSWLASRPGKGER